MVLNTFSSLSRPPTEQASTTIEPFSSTSVASPASTRDSYLETKANPRHDSRLDASSKYSGLSHLSAAQSKEIDRAIVAIENSSLLNVAQRRDVVTSLIQDLARPELINQGVMATCVPTTIQHHLASQNPLEYAAMIRDLAVEGSYTFKGKNPTTIALSQTTLSDDKQHVPEPYEKRLATERMVQDLFMRYAVSKDGIQYDNASDTSRGVYQGQNVTFKGLCKDHIEHLINGVTGNKSERIDNDGRTTSEDLLHTIKTESENKGGLLVEMRWAGSGDHQLHMLMVKKIEGDVVTLFNPHGAVNPPPKAGAMQQMSLKEFEGRLSCVFLQTDKLDDGRLSAPPLLAKPDSADTPHPIANQKGIIEFHISPPLSSQKSITSQSTLNDSISKKEALQAHGLPLRVIDEPESNQQIGDRVNAEVAAKGAVDSPKRFYRPGKNDDDDDLI